MSPSLVMTLALVGGAVAALVVVVARAAASPSSELSHALAQLGVVRLKELERTWRGRTDEARIELLRQLLEEARSSRAWRWPRRGKPTVLVAGSLLALLLCSLTLLGSVDEPMATPDQLQSAFTFPNSALAQDQHTNAERLNKIPMNHLGWTKLVFQTWNQATNEGRCGQR